MAPCRAGTWNNSGLQIFRFSAGEGGLAALNRRPSPPPTIIVTMYAGDDERARAQAAGAAGFLSKSTPLPDLAAAVRAAAAGETFMEESRTAEVDEIAQFSYQQSRPEKSNSAKSMDEICVNQMGEESKESLANRIRTTGIRAKTT